LPHLSKSVTHFICRQLDVASIDVPERLVRDIDDKAEACVSRFADLGHLGYLPLNGFDNVGDGVVRFIAVLPYCSV
jgi:hypothetical protein